MRDHSYISSSDDEEISWKSSAEDDDDEVNFLTHNEEEGEEESFDPKLQTPLHVESTDDEEVQGVNIEGEEMDEEENNEEDEGGMIIHGSEPSIRRERDC
ncbi:hypothetical protein Tco_0228073 [Tanacetum coccineum]